MKQERKSKMILKTICSAFVLILFDCIGGAISQINKMNEVNTKFTQGIFIWLAVLAVVLFEKIRKKDLKELGFSKVREGGWKDLLYCIPVFGVAVAGALNGFDFRSVNYVLAAIFMTVGIGFSEEIYFRSLIFQFWKSQGTKKAIIVSSVVFGVCHFANMIGGADPLGTVLQVVFATVYGIVFAFMFALSGSLVPGIMLHFLHDFIAYTGREMSSTQEVVVVVLQTVLLILYIVLMSRMMARKKYETGMMQ